MSTGCTGLPWWQHGPASALSSWETDDMGRGARMALTKSWWRLGSAVVDVVVPKKDGAGSMGADRQAGRRPGQGGDRHPEAQGGGAGVSRQGRQTQRPDVVDQGTGHQVILGTQGQDADRVRGA